MATTTRAPATSTKTRYIPRGRNQLHTIFDRYLAEFCDVYDERLASKYGMFRLDRIRDICERFRTCGDYRLGVARIRCTNPACGHDYFRPFSCKGFYLCPSCSQKRTLLFAEHLANEVLLDLPDRQFVFTMPKALRPFFRHDRRLFAEVSRLIYTIISEFYAFAAGKSLLSGVIAAHQTFGDQLRCEPCSSGIPELQAECLWHSASSSLPGVGGDFDEERRFIHVPLSGLDQMTEVFRRRLIWLLVEKDLLAEEFARNLLSWKNSGFSIDNSVRLTDAKSKESLAEYIARPPLSLKKIRYEPFKGKVLFHTKYSDYFIRCVGVLG